MTTKKTMLMIFSIILMASTLLTCGLLDRPMTLILPKALYDNNTTAVEGLIQIYDKESAALIVKLEIVPANDDYDEDNNNNNDPDDELRLLLTIPPFVEIAPDTLSKTISCLPRKSDVMGSAEYKDVSVKASALHYQDAYATVTIFNSDLVKATEKSGSNK